MLLIVMTLLRLAAHQHLSVVNAFGRNLSDLAQADSRLPRSVIRIVVTASIHFYRADSDASDYDQRGGLPGQSQHCDLGGTKLARRQRV